MSKQRFWGILGSIFGFAGLLTLVLGCWSGVSAVRFVSSAERVDGEVIDMAQSPSVSRGPTGVRSSDAWHPIVTFRADGRSHTFRSNAGSNPPQYRIGETVQVAYTPGNPDDARLSSFEALYLVPLIFGGLGLLFTPIGTVALLKARQAAAQQAWLRKHGHTTWAQIAHVGPDFRISISGRHPYVVHATWRDEQTGRTYTATSDHLRHDPGPRLLGRTHARVLFDPSNPDRNLLDLE
jgi:Protein of unknown function (DUF3592)